jgi:hypothetical protein
MERTQKNFIVLTLILINKNTFFDYKTYFSLEYTSNKSNSNRVAFVVLKAILQ